MMYRLRLGLDRLRTSLWFVPALIVLGALLLAYGMLFLDAHLPPAWWTRSALLKHILDVRLAGASSILQAIGGSIITIAGVVFSITIAAMTLAAGQYTSRVLRNFIRDRANQAVLGIFLGIFVYCLSIMRSLSGVGSDSHAPPLAMLMTFVLAFIGIATLIFFIHHISLGLQATNVVAAIARDALPSIDRHFPDRFEPPGQDATGLVNPSGGCRQHVRADCSGYVTGIDLAALVSVGDALDGLVRVWRGPGRFVAEGEVVAEWQGDARIDEDALARIRAAWSYATQRTLENDPGYGLRQLVDVALKALSPGVNETTTGIMCVNWLGVILLRMAGRRFPAQFCTSDTHVRVLTHAPRLGDYIALAFDQIRQNAAGNTAILMRLLEVLQALAESPGAGAARQPILRQAAAIETLVETSIDWAPDREPMRQALDQLRQALGDAAPPPGATPLP